MADDLATLDAAAKLRATQDALEEALATRDRERREARKRLREYGWHKPECGEPPCTCGWEEEEAKL